MESEKKIILDIDTWSLGGGGGCFPKTKIDRRSILCMDQHHGPVNE